MHIDIETANTFAALMRVGQQFPTELEKTKQYLICHHCMHLNVTGQLQFAITREECENMNSGTQLQYACGEWFHYRTGFLYSRLIIRRTLYRGRQYF